MTAPHDRPTPAELVEAVREFLEEEVLEATEGAVHFHTRVAVNALGIAGRELALGSVQEERLAQRLQALGVASEAELGAAIRSGDLDSRYEEVKATIAEIVRDKLAVANPGYADG